MASSGIEFIEDECAVVQFLSLETTDIYERMAVQNGHGKFMGGLKDERRVNEC
jgi:hypothetical protein